MTDHFRPGHTGYGGWECWSYSIYYSSQAAVTWLIESHPRGAMAFSAWEPCSYSITSGGGCVPRGVECGDMKGLCYILIKWGCWTRAVAIGLCSGGAVEVSYNIMVTHVRKPVFQKPDTTVGRINTKFFPRSPTMLLQAFKLLIFEWSALHQRHIYIVYSHRPVHKTFL